MKIQIFYLLLLCLMVLGRGEVWADETYTVTTNGSTINTTSGSTDFATSTTYQATEHIQLYIGSGWNISTGEITGTAQPANGNGTYNNQSNYLLPTSGSYLIITPSQNGSITVNGRKNSGSNKYLHIQTSNTNFVSGAAVTLNETACEWKNERNGYNVTTTGAVVATFSVQSGTTYYIFFNQFNDWSFTGFTFTKQKIDVAASDFGFLYTYRNTHSGETFSGNPLVNRLNLPVAYSSSNESAATVNPSTGEVTIQNVTNGIETTTITASFAGNDDYNAKDVTYDINVAPALVYTDIAISNLRYRPGVNGISGNQLNRSVGGFDLTFGNNEGIKCNNTNNFYFRTNGSGAKGSMTIALDGTNNNGSNYIKKIVFTAWGTPSLSVNSVARTSGTLTQTGTSEWTWTNYYADVKTVTFSSEGENDESILISNIRIYTNSETTYDKITPFPGFNRSSDSKAVGETVNISDLDISTTPGSFLFDYTFNAGGTGLSHTPYTNNTTWPGTISGTATAGTATIAASFDGTSNPFFNTVASTTVYTLTVSSAAKNTFVWDFTKAFSDVDTKLLNDTQNPWKWDSSKSNWIHDGGNATSGAIAQNGKVLELAYGLIASFSSGDDNTLIYGNGGGLRLNKGDNRYLRIPNLKAGDKVSIICHNYSTGRGINQPGNIKDDGAENWGSQSSTDFTCVGYVKADGDVDLSSTSAMDIKKITVESINKPWPSLSFAKDSPVSTEIPYGATTTNFTNVLSGAPTDATVTYSVLLGNAEVEAGQEHTGQIKINGTGEVIVRAVTTGSSNYSDYYCDYILTVSQADEYASLSYTADSKEIDGEDRPYQGTVTFTGSGVIKAADRVVTAVPGITMTIGNLNESWYVAEIDGVLYSKTDAATVRDATSASAGNFYKFVPSVNGFLTLNGKSVVGRTLLVSPDDDGSADSKNDKGGNGSFSGDWELAVPLKAGKTYYVVGRTAENAYFYLHSFTFRPAFLKPDLSAEQTTSFTATSSTGKYDFPKLVDKDIDAGVRFSGNRSVVNLSSDGGVTLVGGGTAVIRGKVLSGNNSLTAYYTLVSNVLSVESTTPANGATITTLDNNSFYVQFSANISESSIDATKVVVLKDAETLTGISVSRADNSYPNYEQVLMISNFPTPLEAGSTYTIRIMSECVTKDGDATVKNPEYIGTFIVESTEPPLTWFYPTTTSAVRIGTSIVLKTNQKIDEHYPAGGIWGKLTYEGCEDEDYPMVIKAMKDDNKIVFKPSKPLEPNKLYTLTVEANQVKYNGSTNMITKDKVFLFTTGTGTGAAPTVTGNNSSQWSHSAGTVKLTFNVNIELEPYSTISLTPINGNEPTASGTSAKLSDSGVLTGSKIDISGNELSFGFSEDELKYDLWYELILPNNTVTGPGGQPNNEDYVFRFKMDPKGSGLVETAFTSYPYTWNFTNFGTVTQTMDDLESISSSQTSSRWQLNNGHYSNYVGNNKDTEPFFPQGEVATYNKNGTDTEIREMSGLRWSLVKYYGSGNDRMQIPTSGTSLNLIGGTHYLTIPNVPAGRLYIKARNSYKFDINTPEVIFVQGGQLDNTKGAVDQSNDQVFILYNPTQQDVSFCLQDVNFKIIAVATEEKAISSVGYATNARSFPVDYTLDGTLLGTGVKAYKITGVNGNSVVAEPVERVPATTEEGQYNGVMLHGSEGSWPLFTLDINSSTDNFEGNLLKGVVIGSEAGKLYQKTGDYYNYILSNGGYVVKYDPDNAATGETVGKADGLGFYLVLEEGSKVNGVAYEAEYPNNYTAYLQIGSELAEYADVTGVSSTRRFFSIDFDDEPSGTNINRSYLNRADDNSAWYTLQGVRIANPGKGFYIHNGKKIVIK